MMELEYGEYKIRTLVEKDDRPVICRTSWIGKNVISVLKAVEMDHQFEPGQKIRIEIIPDDEDFADDDEFLNGHT
jgi:hypothetical protein